METTQKSLSQIADELLSKKGFAVDGTLKKSKSRGQIFFEKRILKTPMGNGSR